MYKIRSSRCKVENEEDQVLILALTQLGPSCSSCSGSVAGGSVPGPGRRCHAAEEAGWGLSAGACVPSLVGWS